MELLPTDVHLPPGGTVSTSVRTKGQKNESRAAERPQELMNGIGTGLLLGQAASNAGSSSQHGL